MKINYLIISITLSLFFSCTSKEDGYHRDFNSLKQIASTEGFKPYEGNPVISPGSVGTFDAGALGSMTILKVEDTFHIYYEGWGVRSEKEWDAAEYETLQIGHATSKDGIHWTKDPNNPVLTQGKEGECMKTDYLKCGTAVAVECILTTAGLMLYRKTAATLKKKVS
jgi:hypothetical protein